MGFCGFSYGFWCFFGSFLTRVLDVFFSFFFRGGGGSYVFFVGFVGFCGFSYWFLWVFLWVFGGYLMGFWTFFVVFFVGCGGFLYGFLGAWYFLVFLVISWCFVKLYWCFLDMFFCWRVLDLFAVCGCLDLFCCFKLLFEGFILGFCLFLRFPKGFALCSFPVCCEAKCTVRSGHFLGGRVGVSYWSLEFCFFKNMRLSGPMDPTATF